MSKFLFNKLYILQSLAEKDHWERTWNGIYTSISQLNIDRFDIPKTFEDFLEWVEKFK